MYGSTKSMLQNHGGIQGVDLEKCLGFFSSEVLGVRTRGFSGDPPGV